MLPCEMARYIAGFRQEARKYGRFSGRFGLSGSSRSRPGPSQAVTGTSSSPKYWAIGRKSPSLCSNGRRFSIHHVPIRRSMVLRTVMPRRRKDRKLRAASTAIASPAIGTISKRRKRDFDIPGHPFGVQSLQDFAKHQISNDNLFTAQGGLKRRNVRGATAVEEIDPHAAVDDDQVVPRPRRLRQDYRAIDICQTQRQLLAADAA